ncbi:MAG: phosphoribosyltransferase [Chloroflexi bacterium]|nr:phosphoribosyltransferase [Chloroflexota bacterium]
MIFRDRRDAGEQLATQLQFLANQPDVIALGIPRGGVVVAAQVARALNVSLDVFIARKLGAPMNPELAIGAVTSTGDVLLDDELVRDLRISDEVIEREVEYQRKEIERRLEMYRQDRTLLDVKNKTVVLIDDGIATGSTVLASLRSLRKQGPMRLILAVPVAPAETMKRLEHECDQAIVLATPEPFLAVGRFYLIFDQTSDEEVVALLADSNLR